MCCCLHCAPHDRFFARLRHLTTGIGSTTPIAMAYMQLHNAIVQLIASPLRELTNGYGCITSC